jgi:Bacterial TSP3 repeat
MTVKNNALWIGVLMVALGLAGAGPGKAQGGPDRLSPDIWVHDEDSDGDGLTDAFEIAHGLDPHKMNSFADGTPDEARRDAEGRTMWEVQEADRAAAASRGETGSRACGLTGLEVLIFLLLVRVSRR